MHGVVRAIASREGIAVKLFSTKLGTYTDFESARKLIRGGMRFFVIYFFSCLLFAAGMGARN